MTCITRVLVTSPMSNHVWSECLPCACFSRFMILPLASFSACASFACSAFLSSLLSSTAPPSFTSSAEIDAHRRIVLRRSARRSTLLLLLLDFSSKSITTIPPSTLPTSYSASCANAALASHNSRYVPTLALPPSKMILSHPAKLIWLVRKRTDLEQQQARGSTF